MWSRTRRYPGIRTRNDTGTYALSDAPMPAHHPQWPTGEQVQQYLARYAEEFGLVPSLRLGTEVVQRSRPGAGAGRGGWTLTTREVVDGATSTQGSDWLVVVNGVLSEPAVPSFEGVEEFVAAGGRLCAPSGLGDLGDLEDVRGRDVVVVGYGTSARRLWERSADLTGTDLPTT